MKHKESRDGQAMIEFMIGLIGIMILLLALNQVASIVYNDFKTIYSAREEVADKLVDMQPGSASYDESQSYDPSPSIDELAINISGEGSYENFLGSYPSDRPDGFGFLWSGEDPLRNMTGSQKSSAIAVTAPLFKKLLGRDSIKINNAAWMPPWDDLMQ
ncbi:MAG: hypothetical protein K9M45_10190 [Kiritimatiellales bacterium]|nr:hypothetical protein [Kiritimatiellales bacterium]